jgi:hypothetical protein
VLIVIVVVVVVVAVILVGLLALGLFAYHVVKTIEPSEVTIAAAGATWPLPAAGSKAVGAYSLTESDSWSVTGEFNGSAQDALYVMNSGQYGSWGGLGAPTSYEWSIPTSYGTGLVEGTLGSGTYWFVWYNSNTTAGSTVTITDTILASSF